MTTATTTRPRKQLASGLAADLIAAAPTGHRDDAIALAWPEYPTLRDQLDINPAAIRAMPIQLIEIIFGYGPLSDDVIAAAADDTRVTVRNLARRYAAERGVDLDDDDEHTAGRYQEVYTQADSADHMLEMLKRRKLPLTADAAARFCNAVIGEAGPHTNSDDKTYAYWRGRLVSLLSDMVREQLCTRSAARHMLHHHSAHVQALHGGFLTANSARDIIAAGRELNPFLLTKITQHCNQSDAELAADLEAAAAHFTANPPDATTSISQIPDRWEKLDLSATTRECLIRSATVYAALRAAGEMPRFTAGLHRIISDAVVEEISENRYALSTAEATLKRMWDGNPEARLVARQIVACDATLSHAGATAEKRSVWSAALAEYLWDATGGNVEMISVVVALLDGTIAASDAVEVAGRLGA